MAFTLHPPLRLAAIDLLRSQHLQIFLKAYETRIYTFPVFF